MIQVPWHPQPQSPNAMVLPHPQASWHPSGSEVGPQCPPSGLWTQKREAPTCGPSSRPSSTMARSSSSLSLEQQAGSSLRGLCLSWLCSLLPQQEAAAKENKTTTESPLICRQRAWRKVGITLCCDLWPSAPKFSAAKGPRVLSPTPPGLAPGSQEMRGSK